MSDTQPDPAELSPPAAVSESAEQPAIPTQSLESPKIPKEHAPMLDVHPAHHAANSWKEFFVHIATIVLGLLIAVGLEQTVEYVHHRRELSEARKALSEEKAVNIENFHHSAASFRAS